MSACGGWQSCSVTLHYNVHLIRLEVFTGLDGYIRDMEGDKDLLTQQHHYQIPVYPKLGSLKMFLSPIRINVCSSRIHYRL